MMLVGPLWARICDLLFNREPGLDLKSKSCGGIFRIPFCRIPAESLHFDDTDLNMFVDMLCTKPNDRRPRCAVRGSKGRRLVQVRCRYFSVGDLVLDVAYGLVVTEYQIRCDSALLGACNVPAGEVPATPLNVIWRLEPSIKGASNALLDRHGCPKQEGPCRPCSESERDSSASEYCRGKLMCVTIVRTMRVWEHAEVSTADLTGRV